MLRAVSKLFTPGLFYSLLTDKLAQVAFTSAGHLELHVDHASIRPISATGAVTMWLLISAGGVWCSTRIAMSP